jgi:hypothetical protein
MANAAMGSTREPKTLYLSRNWGRVSGGAAGWGVTEGNGRDNNSTRLSYACSSPGLLSRAAIPSRWLANREDSEDVEEAALDEVVPWFRLACGNVLGVLEVKFAGNTSGCWAGSGNIVSDEMLKNNRVKLVDCQRGWALYTLVVRKGTA